MDRAKDQYVHDIEGKRYLDFFGGILTVSVGHCNDTVTEKVKAQMDRVQHTSTLYPTEAIVNLAEKMAEITPGNLQKCFFTNSGTEANESAVQLARMATGRFEVVALRHGYSGHSMVAKSLTAHAPWRAGGMVSVGIVHALSPYCYRCPLKLTYPECEVACAQDVEEVMPDWVDEGADGYKRVTFRGFEDLTVEAMRELRTENAALRARLAHLEDLVTKLVAADGEASQRSNTALLAEPNQTRGAD